MNSGLFIVATPIGNLSDLSPRALKALAEVDFIAAEDTRVTLKLLTHFGISKPMVSYHDHNKDTATDRLAQRIAAGESCALVTDAGMPAVSDPGCELVAACRAAGLPVTVLPGPSAAVCAVALSGFSDRRFSFEGFLPTDGKARREALSRAAGYGGLLIFYEAPHRLAKTLSDLAAALGDQKAALCREISKIYEDTELVTLAAAAADPKYAAAKGEFVIVIQNRPAAAGDTLAEATGLAKELIEMGVSASDAAKWAARRTGARKNEVYARLTE